MSLSRDHVPVEIGHVIRVYTLEQWRDVIGGHVVTADWRG